MIKGLGHLIRIVFGGRQPAPALPSHTTGGVEAEAAVPPLASDDVLRRAMEAAGEAEAEGTGPSGAGPRYEAPQIEEISSLPTLFLHGKPSEPLAQEPEPEEVAPEEVTDVDVAPVTDVAPVKNVTPEPALSPAASLSGFVPEEPEERVSLESVASTRDHLRAGMAYEEIDFAARASELILFGREFATHAERVVRVGASPSVQRETAAIVPDASVEMYVQDVRVDAEGALDEVAPVASADDLVEEGVVDDVLTSADELRVEQPSADEPVADAALADEAPRKTTRRKAEPGTTTRRKKSAKALPEDAVWLTDAVIWTQCGSWREFWLPPTDPESSARVEEFRILAAEGQLTVWGRTGEALEWTPIAASHWKKAGFDPLAFLAGRENAFSQAPVKKSRTKPPADPVRYSSLMVSKSAIEAIWAARSSSEAAVA